jgi:hypothetical protein
MSAYDELKVKKVKKEDIPPLEPVEYPVTSVEEIHAAAPPVEAAPEVKPFKHTSWWHTPNYLKATEELQAAGRERMKLEEQRAKRNRNMALFGDMARLVGQMYARNGGGYVEKFTPQTQIENEKLAAIRDKNAAQIMAYSRELQAARQADAENFAKRLQTEQKIEQDVQAAKAKADKEAYDRAWEQYKQGKTEEYRENQLAQAKAREERLKTQGGYSGETARVYDEYQEMIAENPELAVKRKVAKRDELGSYVKDENGNQVYEEVEELNPTINQVRNALAKGKIKAPENKKTPVKGFGDVKAKKEVKGF